MTWEVTHASDTGPDDDYYHEWWEVSNGTRTFKCEVKADAEWLCAALNTLEQK
jgi:predicted secreted hydrolase